MRWSCSGPAPQVLVTDMSFNESMPVFGSRRMALGRGSGSVIIQSPTSHRLSLLIAA